VFEGSLVVVAARSIFHTAYLGLVAPKPLDAPLEGLAINAGASVINSVWAWLCCSGAVAGVRQRSLPMGGTC
jgi:hypothetical protein